MEIERKIRDLMFYWFADKNKVEKYMNQGHPYYDNLSPLELIKENRGEEFYNFLRQMMGMRS